MRQELLLGTAVAPKRMTSFPLETVFVIGTSGRVSSNKREGIGQFSRMGRLALGKLGKSDLLKTRQAAQISQQKNSSHEAQFAELSFGVFSSLRFFGAAIWKRRERARP